ncbi:MAG TPA: glycoside hydrolase family 78 protein [Verrucomicrobiae bacterium]|nr:glycoside hydrolase family 78 protein [Verrucomicrobiae bacterium]
MKRAILIAVLVGVEVCKANMNVSQLRCEYLSNPLGIDAAQPRLSWVPESDQRGQRQTAYRILVASLPTLLDRGQGDLWDSGKVAGDDTTAIVYEGRPLTSGSCCYWKVRVWDKNGKASTWSDPASWTMGLLQASDWKGDWIGYDAGRRVDAIDWVPYLQTSTNATKVMHLSLPPAVYLRGTFRCERALRRATLYATGLGIFEAHLNGHRVSDDYFNPCWTDYRKRVYYRAYDVTDLVRHGKNALGAVLADGWYSGYAGYDQRRDHYGQKPRVRLQLDIEYEDGSSAVVGTGPDWKASTGPIREADLQMGETYDARRTMDGWDKPVFDDREWKPVDTGAELQPFVRRHPGPPVRAIAEFRPKSITEPKPGMYVFDLGQNFAGVTQLKVRGKPGQKITLQFAERLNPDGTAYTTNLRMARATDTYICRGRGVETWQPRFTVHGFQYVEVTGLTRKPTTDTVVGVALSSDTPVVGSFGCSDPMLNMLHSNIYWTQRANFIDVPTDCPQRNERLGWTGDAQVYVRTATLNTDVQAFFTKWLVDLDDGQTADGQFPKFAPLSDKDDSGPAWADAGVICPWTIYEVYGDRRVLEKHYNAMTRFIAFCQNRSTAEMLPPAKYHCYGDWLSINADTPRDVICTAYFAHSARLTAQAAEVLGKQEDAVRYNELFKRIKVAFNRAYVTDDGRIQGDTQCGYVLALAFDLVDGEKAKLAAQHLVENIQNHGWHLTTGFIGTKDLMLVLARIGRNDVAYHLIHSDTFPSWGFSIKNGATSIWERWNGWTPDHGFFNPSMNSFAHYSFGAVYQWMVETIGGIRTDGPSFKKIIIAPEPDDRLMWAKTSYSSIRGDIRTAWKKTRRGLVLDVTVPVNTTATVVLPTAREDAVTEGGVPLAKAEGVKLEPVDGNRTVLAVESGNYHFLLKNRS